MSTAAAPMMLTYRGPIRPRFVSEPDGKFTIPSIPIFKTHTDRGWKCDAVWMEGCVRRQREDAANGHLPKVIIGHTPDDPSGVEKPVVAMLDNYRFDPNDGHLYADFVHVPEHVKQVFERNEYPARSPEVYPREHYIPSVALLGGTPPYLRMPDMVFGKPQEGRLCYRYIVTEEEPKMSEQTIPKLGEDDYKAIADQVVKYLKPAEPAPAATESKGDDKAESDQVLKYRHQVDQLQAQNADLVKQCEALRSRQDKIVADAARQKYSARLDQMRIPATLIDRDAMLDHVMAQPEDKRDTAFELYAKPLRSIGPARGPVNLDNAPSEGSADDGFAQWMCEPEQVRKYRGDIFAGRRDYDARAESKS